MNYKYYALMILLSLASTPYTSPESSPSPNTETQQEYRDVFAEHLTFHFLEYLLAEGKIHITMCECGKWKIEVIDCTNDLEFLS